MSANIIHQKNCTICKKLKPISGFSKNKRRKDGHQLECKECCININYAYHHTVNGVITMIYSKQRSQSKLRGHAEPSYSKRDFTYWILSQPLFNKLFKEWEKSGYDKTIKPSCDRLDDYKGYSFDNIRLITWQENVDKAYADRKKGVNNKVSKAVKQYSLCGEVIAEYHSLREAERQTGVFNSGISACCLGKYKKYGGYVWCFA